MRYKKNIRTVSNALDKIMDLHGVNFDWRQDEFPDLNFDDDEQIGFIAQEIKEILPEVVSQDGKGFYTVAYSRVVPVFVEAIKEQQKITDEQNSELAQVRAKVVKFAEMETRIAKLESALDKLETLTAAR